MTQLKGRIIFMGMVALIAIIVFLIIGDGANNHKIEFIRYSHIYSVRIDGGSLLEKDSIIIKNKDSTAGISKLLMSSKPVNFDQINVKPNKGTCYITINYDDNRNIQFSLTNAASGGVIESGSYYYVNDRLLSFVMELSIHHQ